MAREFPDCRYYGCDITHAISKKMNVPNFSFREGNVVKGLPYEDNTFDLVQMRLLVFALGKEDWPKAIQEAIRVVKPGGSNDIISKGLRWDVIELIRSSITHIKPFLGLETEDEIRDYLKTLDDCMGHANCWFNTVFVAAQKLT
ncbi:hypothetical protein BY458DRAFT_488684 [Sporodiniella umbellata]|nr:hypothetical protein BY458DRAFT_488684 [Sporodiniella umbellata]